jgi:ABC-type glutathione transport system ATPase component
MSGQVGAQVSCRRSALAARQCARTAGVAPRTDRHRAGRLPGRRRRGREHRQADELQARRHRLSGAGRRRFPVTRSDLKQIYAADERAHVEIGTVYPTKDIRAACWSTPFLGKHFALLGSTGTGKSTSAALIMHKICDMSPEGHIVMIDPHGEYSAAFKGHGELFNVDNLAMPIG